MGLWRQTRAWSAGSIAAAAALLDADLLTTNVRHFPMIAGLEPAY